MLTFWFQGRTDPYCSLPLLPSVGSIGLGNQPLLNSPQQPNSAPAAAASSLFWSDPILGPFAQPSAAEAALRGSTTHGGISGDSGPTCHPPAWRQEQLISTTATASGSLIPLGSGGVTLLNNQQMGSSLRGDNLSAGFRSCDYDAVPLGGGTALLAQIAQLQGPPPSYGVIPQAGVRSPPASSGGAIPRESGGGGHQPLLHIPPPSFDPRDGAGMHQHPSLFSTTANVWSTLAADPMPSLWRRSVDVTDGALFAAPGTVIRTGGSKGPALSRISMGEVGVAGHRMALPYSRDTTNASLVSAVDWRYENNHIAAAFPSSLSPTPSSSAAFPPRGIPPPPPSVAIPATPLYLGGGDTWKPSGDPWVKPATVAVPPPAYVPSVPRLPSELDLNSLGAKHLQEDYSDSVPQHTWSK